MIIVDNNLSQERLENNPIYRLTGCMETTKFFSNLASSVVKFGNYTESVIFKVIESTDMDKLDYIGQTTIFGTPEKYILIKPKFGSEVPDVVLVDDKNLHVFEIKVNLRSSDSKKAHGEKVKYERLKEYLQEHYKDYNTQIYAVDFLGGGGGATALYEKADVFTVIDGKTFCSMMGIQYDVVVNSLEVDQEQNRKFIQDYITAMHRKTL